LKTLSESDSRPQDTIDLKRWLANHQAVNARVRAERRLLTPAASLRIRTP